MNCDNSLYPKWKLNSVFTHVTYMRNIPIYSAVKKSANYALFSVSQTSSILQGLWKVLLSYLAWLQEPGPRWASWQRGLSACPGLRRGASYPQGPPSLWGAIQQRDNMQIRSQWRNNGVITNQTLMCNLSKIDELKGSFCIILSIYWLWFKILSTPDSVTQFLMTSKRCSVV